MKQSSQSLAGLQSYADSQAHIRQAHNAHRYVNLPRLDDLVPAASREGITTAFTVSYT